MKPRETSAADARVRVVAALDALPELDRLVLSLHLLEGLTPLEAAGALRLSEQELSRRTQSALRTLSRRLGLRTTSRRVA